ncbi:uncharacterized protein involved in type VI secretion and phage assembly [Oxalobacteraceae bacterium GrIS 1.11]
MNGADGGFARYTLTIAPWTGFLALGRDSRVFRGKNMMSQLKSQLRNMFRLLMIRILNTRGLYDD